ncbi:MAG: FeoA family protein [Desulfovibrio sp.]|uniref:FeoA family protein n=1 Tax=Desulfovibrio sp. 7SRBS1 TaxID=3378064 RepID=UPI003B3D3EBD
MTLLSDIPPGRQCCIRKLRAKGCLGRRLMDLGFHPGVRAKVLRNAPLLDPVEIMINGSLLSIRHEEARQVEVDDK